MGVGDSKDRSYDPSKDLCHPHLQTYLKCVEGKREGLKEGDECLAEAQSYKTCRKEERREILEKSLREQAEDILKKKQLTAETVLKDIEHQAELVLSDAKKKAEEFSGK